MRQLKSSPQTISIIVQYYFLKLILRNTFLPRQVTINVEYFVLLLGDSPAVYVATALSMCLKKEKNRPWTKEGCIKRPQYTRENLTRDLVASEPNDYKVFFAVPWSSI
jgi:hypothetical protein